MSIRTLYNLYAVSIVAIIIQSVWIGGGYGSGRELVEFIAKYGSLGLISLIVSAILTGVAVFLSCEISRIFKAFDYMNWTKQFLWRVWPIFDIAYVVLAWIVIAVLASFAGYMLSDMLGVHYIIGTIITIIVVGVLHFYGRRAIEAFWVVGTIGLYVAYVLIILYFLWARGGQALSNIVKGLTIIGDPIAAAIDGFRYTMYNLAVVIPALAAVDRFKKRFESALAAIFSVILVYGLALLLWIIFMAYYPDVINMTAPIYDLLKHEGLTWLLAFFFIWVFYTLIETALGMVYGLVRRIDAQLGLRGKRLTRSQEALLSIIIIIIAVVTAQVGLVALVAKGYGTLAWVFAIVYFIPLVTIGLIRIMNPEWKKEFWATA